MKKNMKYFIVLITLLFLTISVASASDNTTTHTNTDTLEQTTHTVEKVATSTEAKKIEKQDNNHNKSIKTDAQTKDYYVSDTSGSDTNTGTQNSPFKTIQTAIDKTGNDATYNIHILEGTYKGQKNTNLTVNGNNKITFIGANINKTVIDGEANYTLHVTQEGDFYWESSKFWEPYDNGTGNWIMNITQGTGNIKITNITIQNSWATGINGGDRIDKYPYATIDNYGNLEIDQVSFLNNHGGVGSAIRNNNEATLLVTNSKFKGNRKSMSTGNEGIIYNNGTTTIKDSLFEHNYVRWGSVLNDKKLTVLNTTFKENIGYDGRSGYKMGTGIAADSGGADYFNVYNSTNVITTIENCEFINNEQCDIFQGINGNLFINNSTFNKSTGIYFTATDSNTDYEYTISNSTFEDMIPSTLFVILYQDTGKTFSIYNNMNYNKLNIENNEFLTENSYILIESNNTQIKENNINTNINITGGNNLITLNNITQQVNIDGSKNNITKNNINTTDSYTVNLLKKDNTITENALQSYSLFGDNSVKSQTQNTIENNTPTNDNIILTEENYQTYFNNAVFNDTKLSGDTIYVRGEIKNKQLIFESNKKINIIGLEDNILQNTSITINANTKVNIENLNMNNTNSKNKYQIQLNTQENTIKNSKFYSNQENIYSIHVKSNDNTITNNEFNTTNAINIENSQYTIITQNNIYATNNTIQIKQSSYTTIENNILNQNNEVGGDLTINEIESTNTVLHDNTPILFTLTDDNYNKYFENEILKINTENLTIQLGSNLYNKNLVFNNIDLKFYGNKYTIYNGSMTTNTKTYIYDTNFNSTNNLETIISAKDKSTYLYNSTIYQESNKAIKTLKNTTIRYSNITVNNKESENNEQKTILDNCDTSYSYIKVNSVNDNSPYEVTKLGRITYSNISIEADNITAINNSYVSYNNICVIGRNYANGILRTNDSINATIRQFQGFQYNNITVESNNIAIGLLFGEMPDATIAGDISQYNNYDVKSNNTGCIILIKDYDQSQWASYEMLQNNLKGTNVDGLIIKNATNQQAQITIRVLNITLNNTSNNYTPLLINNTKGVSMQNVLIESNQELPLIKIENSTKITLTSSNLTSDKEGYIAEVKDSTTVAFNTNYLKTANRAADDTIKNNNSTITYSKNTPGLKITNDNYDQYFINQTYIGNKDVIELGSDFYNKSFIFNKAITVENNNNYTIYNGTIRSNNGTVILNNLNLNFNKDNTTIIYGEVTINNGYINIKSNNSILFDANNTALMSFVTFNYNNILIEGNNLTIFNANMSSMSQTIANYNNITINGENITLINGNNKVAVNYNNIILNTNNSQVIKLISGSSTISTNNINMNGDNNQLLIMDIGSTFSSNNVNITTSTPLTQFMLNDGTTRFRRNNIKINCAFGDTPIIYTKQNRVTDNYIESLDLIGDNAVYTDSTATIQNNNPNTHPVEITIEEKQLTIGKEEKIQINITDTFKNPITGQITATINNKPITINNNEIIFTPTEETQEIKITFTDPTGKYNTTTQTKNLTATKQNTQITVTIPNENTVNKTTPVTIIILDEEGNLIRDTTINITINNKTEEVTLENGILVYQFTPETVGNTTAKFSFAGNYAFNPTETEATINVVADKDKIIEDLNKNLTETTEKLENTTQKAETLEKQLKDANQTINNQKATLDNLNKTLTQTQKDLQNANKKITEQNQTINNLNKQLTDANNKINTLNKSNNDLNNKLTEANKKIDTLTKQNTDLEKQLADLKQKVDTLTKTVDNLNKTVAARDNTIKELTTKVATKITVTKINTTTYAGKVTVTGKVTDKNGKALNNMPVNIKINTGTTKAVTNANGVYTYTTTAWSIGTSNVTVSAIANYKYTSSSAKTTFKVSKAKPVLKLNSISAVKYKDKVTVTGSLMDNNNKAINGAQITLKINSKSVKVKTAKDGSFTYTTSATSMGTNNITATYNGNTKYNKVTGKTTFKVNKQNLILTVDRVASGLKFKDPLVVGGRLVDGNGKAVANTQVSLKFNGKTYKAKTDKNGYYKVTTRATTMDKNNLTVTYAGNKYYNKATAKTTFTVAKQDIVITFNTVKYSNGKVTISGTFTDRNRHALMNSLARITLNGKQGTAKTDKTGTFTYTTKANKGTYKVTLAYPGNARYNAYSKTSTVKTA